MGKIVVAGASGLVGGEVVDLLKAKGHSVTALVHRTPMKREGVESATWSDLDSALRGADAIVSSAGASIGMSLSARAGFDKVDVPINTRLIEAAERAGVRKMVYVSVACADVLGFTRYVGAHERVVDRLRASKLAYGIVRPTGIFGSLTPFLSMVRLRVVPNFGGGGAKTNPVHERDVALQCVRALETDEREISIGGPDMFTRGEIFDLAMKVAGVRALKIPVPGWWLRFNGWMLSLVHPRLGQFTEFLAAIAKRDTVAPQIGTLRLTDYWAR